MFWDEAILFYEEIFWKEGQISGFNGQYLWQLKNKCLDPEGGIWATHLSGQLRCQFSVTLSIIPTCILSFTIHAPLRLGVQVVWQLEKCDPLSSSLPTSFLPSFPSFLFLLNNISLKKKSKVEIVFAIDSRSIISLPT